MFVLDEFAKFPRGPDQQAAENLAQVTDCRVFISSPKGPEGAFFDVIHKDSNLRKIVLSWDQNPSRNPGLYKVEIASDNSRRVVPLDIKYWKKQAQKHGSVCQTEGDVLRLAELIKDETDDNPFGYEFMISGPFVKHDYPRSPWYDRQCRRPGSTPTGIAQELDRDYGGSTSRFFDVNMLIRLQRTTDPPRVNGDMQIPSNVDSYLDLTKCNFQVMHNGRMSLWFSPDMYGRIPGGRNVVIGIDIAQGTTGVASSNSCASVVDKITGKQMAEFAAPDIAPEDFADYCVALAYWFTGTQGPAELIWEANGPGQQFTNRIIALGYSNVYYRRIAEESSEKETSKMGWWTTNKSKGQLLGEMARALGTGELEVSSHYCLQEAKFYVYAPGGKIIHLAEKTEKDPSAAGERHGDRVIGAALAWWAAKDYITGGSAASSKTVEPPPNCLLARRQKSAREEKEQPAWVPPSIKRRIPKHPRRF